MFGRWQREDPLRRDAGRPGHHAYPGPDPDVGAMSTVRDMLSASVELDVLYQAERAAKADVDLIERLTNDLHAHLDYWKRRFVVDHDSITSAMILRANSPEFGKHLSRSVTKYFEPLLEDATDALDKAKRAVQAREDEIDAENDRRASEAA
jgi:hypothetical protein